MPPQAAGVRPIVHDEHRRPVGLAALREDRLPLRLGAAENAGDEAAGVVAGRPGAARLPARLGRLLDLRIAAARQDFGAADQDAGIDAERPADQAEHDDGADAESAAADRKTESAAAATGFTAAILDVAALFQIIQTHRSAPSCCPATPPGTVLETILPPRRPAAHHASTVNMVAQKVAAPVRRPGQVKSFFTLLRHDLNCRL